MSDQKLLEDKSQLAILYFKAQEYEKALSTYNILINQLKNLSKSTIKQIRKNNNLSESPIIGPIIHPKLGSLLDQRAATYEKLGQITNALKDGKELIKLEPIGCKGYLRTGKLLIGMNKKIEAYKCYQEGLYIIEKTIKEYNIKVPEKLMISLKTQYRTLNKELKQKRRTEDEVFKVEKKKVKRSTDPFNFLPLEVIEIIFQYIPMNQILRLHLVSKLWYFKLTSIPRLYYFKCKPNISLNEFTKGAKLFKKISSNSSLRMIQQIKINQVTTKAHFLKILEVLIREPGMLIQNLDLIDKHFNLQIFYYLLAKFGWRLANLNRLESLRIGINCSIKYGTILLNMFKKLKILEIVIFQNEKSNLDLIPIQEKFFKKLKDLKVDEYPLEKLLLVNHPKLLIDNPNPISAQTYNPYPIFLDKNFPNLTELIIVSFDFSTCLPEFGEFLIRIPQLIKLYLENNQNINMLIFLQMIINYRPMFKLQEFTFRESMSISPISLTEFRLNDLQQFKNIYKLDLYKNCLSVTGLLKLLKICGESIKSLNIGHSHYISFTIHSQRMISLYDILIKCPHLKQMYLNDLDIDQSAMIQINKDLARISSNFQMLDLSFNKIDGISLLRMFDKKLINNPIEILILNGMEISIDTIQYLMKKKYVKNVLFDKSRIKWQIFGVNSWVQ